MKARSKVLFVKGKAVRRMAFEVIPDLFNRVEFRRVAWKPFDMKAGVFYQDCLYDWPFVDSCPVPQENYRSLDMSEESVQKICYMFSFEVILLEACIEPHLFTLGRYGKGRQCRDAVMTIAVVDNRCLAPRPPGAAPCWNEHKSTLIQKCEVGTKFYGFFLLLAICSVSNARSLFLHAAQPGAREPDSSSRLLVKSSRYGQDDTRHRTLS